MCNNVYPLKETSLYSACCENEERSRTVLPTHRLGTKLPDSKIRSPALKMKIGSVMATGNPQMFECITDYHTELVCHWEAAAQMNCSKEFKLHYRIEEFSALYNTCIPENEKSRSMNFTSSCTCVILPEFFTAGLSYHIVLQDSKTVLWNDTVMPANNIKPKPPRNLTVNKSENDNIYVVSWTESYSKGDELHGEEVTYEVKYWNKQNPEEKFIEPLSYQTTSFDILATQLRRGYDYLVSVRCLYPEYRSLWSEWSNVAEFHNNYEVTLEDSLQKIVSISCMLITALILICYFCFATVKKEWWDRIPNPAKSHLVVKNVKAAQFSVWRKMMSIDEIKAPFHDGKQTHMENQRCCKICLAKYAEHQSLMGGNYVKSGEKPCSCRNKCGKWLPEEHEAVLIPEIILVEDSLEVCEYSANPEIESHEDDPAQIPVCQPWETSANSFTEHTQHNDALANMFIRILKCGTNTHDTELPDFIEEHKAIGDSESANSSLQTPKENVVQDQQSCDTSHTCSFSSTTSQDDYKCGAASTKSVQSEESFESGYQSSNTDTAFPEEKNLPDMLHQSHFLCGSETQHDVLIKKSPNAPSSEIIKDGINSTAYKSFSSLMTQSTGSCSPEYKSFSSLVSQAVLSSSLTQCLENPSSSLSLTEFSESQVLPCSKQGHRPLGHPSSYTSHQTDCTESACQTTCSGDIDFPWFSFYGHEKVSFFLPEKELHKQITCQNVPEKAVAISCLSVPNPSSYQPFALALAHNNTYCDHNNEISSESPYKPFISLLNNNLKGTLSAISVCDSDMR
nr:interleukin-4 receptor subunit alpha isoform X1 [Pelodiscus sinensis]|eukprot:XP_014429205.1 interleukin-4 receptor subunit alpha isoform X1 [Pelodiscus sinensis]